VGTWALDVTTGLGNGWSAIFGIDLNSIAASSQAGGTLRITFTETNLNAGFPAGPLSITSAIGGTTQGTVTYKSWFDDSNVAFGQSELLFSGAASSLAFADGATKVVNASDPFSLTLQVDVTHVGAKTTSFDFSASVPEPTSVALLGVALLGAGVATRRRAKKA
jgi:hypothetical protein